MEDTNTQAADGSNTAARLHIQKEIMRWSLEQDEEIAEATPILEAHKRRLRCSTSTEDKQATQRSVKKWKTLVEYLQADQGLGWEYFWER
jgi:hypothetical protein